jgi:hypothetical protein
MLIANRVLILSNYQKAIAHTKPFNRWRIEAIARNCVRTLCYAEILTWQKIIYCV